MEFIYESESPICGLTACVSREKDCYYFYIMGAAEQGFKVLRILWICNRKPAPDELVFPDGPGGGAPMLPAGYVAHDPRGMELDESKMKIVWYESGDCAALFYNNELLCTIPPIAGLYDFPGFSRYAKGQHRYAWGFPDDPDSIIKRAEESAAFWNYMNRDPWQDIQTTHMKAIEGFFGKHEKYYAIDGGNFPPKAIMQGRKYGRIYGITLGVSMFPMPKSDIKFGSDSQLFGRIELGFCAQESYSSICEKMFSYMSGISCMPWRELDILGHGHTIDCRISDRFTNLLLINPSLVPNMEQPVYDEFMGAPVNLLWLVPITDEEMALLNEIKIFEFVKRARIQANIHVFDGKPKFIR
ncbi:MAG: suppressor of fused domain protein [Oscillospiraceae bacterium]|nr:suppressor of fused domain protein [Oscillospiraceae bacterium]